MTDIIVYCSKEHRVEYQEGVCLLCEVDKQQTVIELQGTALNSLTRKNERLRAALKKWSAYGRLRDKGAATDSERIELVAHYESARNFGVALETEVSGE